MTVALAAATLVVVALTATRDFKPRVRRVLLPVLAAIVAGGAARPDPGAFTLTVVDVGQGLAAVVETAQHVLIFDAGPRWRGG